MLFSLLKVEFSANSLAHLQVVENLISGVRGGGGRLRTKMGCPQLNGFDVQTCVNLEAPVTNY